MKLTTEQLERIAKMMPEYWGVTVTSNTLFGCRGGCSPYALWDGETESPEIINWALGELASTGFCPQLEYDDNDHGGWSVSYWVLGSDCPITLGPYPTKTLALVMALLEVCGD